MKFYEYNHINDDLTTIVECVKEHFTKRMSKLEVSDEDITKLNAAVCKYAVEGTSYQGLYEKDGVKCFNNPQVRGDATVMSRFNAVIAEIINAIPMAAVSEKYEEWLGEFRQIGFGDTARFILDANDLFFVEELADGVQRGVVQPLYNDEITVNPVNRNITTAVKWYQIATGKMDWGKFAVKVAQSFDAYVFAMIYNCMGTLVADLGPYTAAGFSDDNWVKLVQLVSAANGGAGVYAIGTLGALSKVYPQTVGLQYGLGEEIAKVGYLNRFKGATLVPVEQVMVPGTINTTAMLALDDNKIYFVSAGVSKPVKVVFEGNVYVHQWEGYNAADAEYKMSVNMHIGCKAVLGPKVGALTLQ